MVAIIHHPGTGIVQPGFYLEILVWGGRGHGTFTHSPLLQTINMYLWVLGVT